MSQRTLGGDVVELEPRTCDVYADDICDREAAYQVGDVAACETCAAEITEPEHPDDAENATKLRATDRLVTDGGQVDDDISHRDLPGNAKAAAVEQWKTALDDLPDDAEWAETLRSADIHDETDRMEIEEVIEHEVPEEYYLPLHDAFDALHNQFER